VDPARVEEVDLLERPMGRRGATRLAVRPFQVITLRLAAPEGA